MTAKSATTGATRSGVEAHGPDLVGLSDHGWHIVCRCGYAAAGRSLAAARARYEAHRTRGEA